MTKRQAILAALSGTIGLMSGRAKAETIPSGGVSSMSVITQMPQTVSFSLNTFKEFTFSLDGESVTITNKEIFDALKDRR